MKKTLLVAVALLASLFVISCEVENANEVSPMVLSDGKTIDVTGIYRNDANTRIVNPANSGAPITLLDLRQTGQNLEAIGSNNEIFRGNIGSASGGNKVTFTLQGATSADQKVTVNGTITVSGDIGTMSGTWIEPTYYATIFAKAIGPSVTSNSVMELKISPTSASISSTNGTQVFTASGGLPPYTWSVANNSLGNVNPVSGATVTYTRSSTNTLNNQVTVQDSVGTTKTVTVTQP